MDKSITELLWGILAVLTLDFRVTHGSDENIDQLTMHLINYILQNLVSTDATQQVVMGDGGENEGGNQGNPM